MNLLGETLELLKTYNIKEEDILYVTDGEKISTWKEIKPKFKSINYDCGFGTAMVNLSLKIYTTDYIIYREEYDGAESWRIIKKSKINLPKGEIAIMEDEYYYI